MKKKLIIFLTILLLFQSNIVLAQSTGSTIEKINTIKKLMLDLGLENIQVNAKDKDDENLTYIISYENRTFLHEIDLLGSLLSKLKRVIKTESSLEIFPQSSGKIISKIDLEYKDYIGFMNGVLSEEQLSERVNVSLNPKYEYSSSKVTNPLLFHSDLVIAPSYILDHTLGPSIFLSPYINTYFGEGFLFNTRVRAPIYNITNSFDFSKNFELYPPGFTKAYIDYATPILDLPLYGSLRAGYWNPGTNNIITSGYLQYLLMGGFINLNLSAGVYHDFTNSITDFSITPSAQLYIGKLDLIIEAGAGKFLYNNYGGWGRVTRQFDDVDLGFMLSKTFGNANSGFGFSFEFTIALGPEHSINASPFRVTYPRFFSGDLTAGSAKGFTVPEYQTQELFIKRLYPEYIKTHLRFWKDY